MVLCSLVIVSSLYLTVIIRYFFILIRILSKFLLSNFTSLGFWIFVGSGTWIVLHLVPCPEGGCTHSESYSVKILIFCLRIMKILLLSCWRLYLSWLIIGFAFALWFFIITEYLLDFLLPCVELNLWFFFNY